MKGFEEIAVIHGINDYDEARFLEGFLKWIGVSFFDYVYNDLYDEFNQHLENSGERFDAVIYINDENDKYISRFGCLSETNIRLSFMLSDNTGVNAGIDEESFENIWKIIIDAIYSNNTNQELYADSEIKPISVNIRKDNAFAKNDKDGCIQIFEELAEIYAENNLFKEIGDGKIYLMNECEMKQDGQMAIEARIKLWETVLDELDKVSINKDNVCFDNFCYAKIYCKKEIHILRCVTEKWVYTDEMRRKFQEIELDIENLPKDGVKYSNMSLGLIFDIYAMNPELYNGGINYQSRLIKKCKTNACKSEALHKLNRFYKNTDRGGRKEHLLEEVVKLNPLNFKAGFSLAMSYMNCRAYLKAKEWILNVLYVLQLEGNSQEELLDNLEKLPKTELEYVWRCYGSLKIIEKNTYNDESAKNYYIAMQEKTKKVLESKKAVDG